MIDLRMIKLNFHRRQYVLFICSRYHWLAALRTVRTDPGLGKKDDDDDDDNTNVNGLRTIENL